MKSTQALLVLSALVLFLVVLPGVAAFKLFSADNGTLVYFGTYTRQQSKGIYVSRFDPATGKLTTPVLAAETASPSFLAVHPNHRFLYAVNEISEFEGQKSGSISAFSVNPESGVLTALNTVTSKGSGPCHLVVDTKGKYVFAANYSGGSVIGYAIAADGKLGESTAFSQHAGSSVHQRQQGPHAHEVVFSPDSRFLFVPDLGLDKLMIYRFDAGKGSLTPNDPPAFVFDGGTGPRHLAFHPKGNFAYTINELSNTVNALAYDADKGTFHSIQSLTTLPKDFSGNSSTAEVSIHPNGKFLYGSNRGNDTIAVFSIDPGKGLLTLVEHVSAQGKSPRHLTIDPTGAFLLAANQNTGNVVVYRIDPKEGRLTHTGQVLDVPVAVCIAFLN
jgi:6-phosphogluconolactonase